VLEEEATSSKENKYTGCNCNKSQCLKMYCACFSVGKMCDQVLHARPRPVSARPAKTTATTWSAHRPSTRSLLAIHTLFPAATLRLISQSAIATARNQVASKSIAIATVAASNADRPASASAATTSRRTNKNYNGALRASKRRDNDLFF
jgi:hypothetical protein